MPSPIFSFIIFFNFIFRRQVCMYAVHTISFQTFFVWALLLIVHTSNSSPFFYKCFSFYTSFLFFSFIYRKRSAFLQPFLFHHSLSSLLFSLSLVSLHIHRHSNLPLSSFPISNYYTYLYPRNSVINIKFICIAFINFILIFIIVIFFTS